MVTGSVTNQHVAGSLDTLENAALRANLGLLLYPSLPLVLGRCAAFRAFREQHQRVVCPLSPLVGDRLP